MEREITVNYTYILNLDGFELTNECTYYSREVLDNGLERLVYPRFHNSDGILTINLIVERDPELGVSCCRLEVENGSDHPVRINRADVGVSMETTRMALDYFSSDWGSEYVPRRQEINREFSFGVISGRSCKGFIPFALCEGDSSATAMALAWSGNWTCTAFRWPEAYCCYKPWTYCCVMGLTDGAFYTDLPAGETFHAPAVYVSSAADGESASLALRRYFRRHISLLDDERFSPLPLEYNTWWAYEDKLITEDIFQQNAEIAKSLGCSYAMMDAGWFGDETDGIGWYEKRGDWDRVNPERFPSGMKAMCDKAKAVEILPGIWCEIEAVGKDALLNKTHQKLLAKREGRSLGYVCFGCRETREWAMEVMDRIAGEYGAKWVKFDFNLDPGMGCDRTDHDHGAGDGLMAHYLGYYAFLEELRAKYPDLVIENCSSGGLRGDLGMLSHCHLTFLSDPDQTDFHLQLYWGALSFLHQSALLHFTWSEVTFCDHNGGIHNPISEDMPRHKFDYIMRAAMMGVPGFSYKLPEMPSWCLERIKELGTYYTAHSSDFILHGDAYRLTPQPLTHGRGERFPVFEFVSEAGDAQVHAFRLSGAPESRTVCLKGLIPEACYEVAFIDSGRQLRMSGRELMDTGISFDGLPEEASEIAEINKIAE